MTLISFAARLATTAVGLVAGWNSYWHIVAVAKHAGEDGVGAYLYPLSIDGLIVAGSMSMIQDRRAGRAPRLSARLALVAGVVATLAANIASAQPSAFSRTVAAWPAFAFLLAVEVLVRSGRVKVADRPAVADSPAPAVADWTTVAGSPASAVADPPAVASPPVASRPVVADPPAVADPPVVADAPVPAVAGSPVVADPPVVADAPVPAVAGSPVVADPPAVTGRPPRRVADRSAAPPAAPADRPADPALEPYARYVEHVVRNPGKEPSGSTLAEWTGRPQRSALRDREEWRRRLAMEIASGERERPAVLPAEVAAIVAELEATAAGTLVKLPARNGHGGEDARGRVERAEVMSG